MTSTPAPDRAGLSPDAPDPSPREEDDIVLSERGAFHHRLPNQHDLDGDDDQVIRTERAAPWADFDDLEGGMSPHAGTPDDDRPSTADI